MKFVFVHQYMPSQYREIVGWLARQNRHQIAFLTQRQNIEMPGVHKILYTPHHVQRMMRIPCLCIGKPRSGRGWARRRPCAAS